jgi:hypothetical protein
LRSRQGQPEATLVTYDVLEVDGHDVQPEVLEERRAPSRIFFTNGAAARATADQLAP